MLLRRRAGAWPAVNATPVSSTSSPISRRRAFMVTSLDRRRDLRMSGPERAGKQACIDYTSRHACARPISRAPARHAQARCEGCVARRRLYWEAMSPSQAAAGLDIGAVQAALAADGLDGWLLYDFRGLNPIAADVTAVGSQGGHLATRRWYYLIPATGEPRGLVHKIERALADASARIDEAIRRPRSARGGPADAAHRHPPRGDGILAQAARFPYVSRIDAGTVELVRQAGAEVVSSGDLIQRFSAVWDAGAIETHRHASDAAVSREGSRASKRSRAGLRDGVATTEYDIQQLMAGWFRDEGLISDVGRRTSRPPRTPATRTTCRRPPRTAPIRQDEIVLLDLWGKLDRRRPRSTPTSPGSVSPGPARPSAYAKAFAADLRRARRRHPRWCRTRSAPDASCAASRSIAPPPLCCARRVTPITSCTGPATASARPCTATA
mgnify:CR=1 FL=1